MPHITVTDTELVIEFSVFEKFLSFSRGWRIPLDHVTSARIDDNVRKDIGWRGAGTGTWNFGAGTFINKGERQFVFIKIKKQTAVVVSLSGEKVNRLILGIDGGRPAAQALLGQLNAG